MPVAREANMCVHRWIGAGLFLVLSACTERGENVERTTITIAGSTALIPLLQEAARRYMREHPNVSVQLSAGGSHVGLAKVAAGDVTLGASDVFADSGANLIDHRVAVVGLAAMANKGPYDKAIDSLTKDEIRDIFTGKIKNWNELGGDDQPIVVINREKTSGTRAAFGELALGGDLFVAGEEQDSSSKVQSTLKQRPGAISYLALSYRDDALMTLSYDGVSPTSENITTNKYPIWAYEHLYSKKSPPEVALNFVEFVTSGRFQREVLPGLGFIPIHDMRVVRDPKL